MLYFIPMFAVVEAEDLAEAEMHVGNVQLETSRQFDGVPPIQVFQDEGIAPMPLPGLSLDNHGIRTMQGHLPTMDSRGEAILRASIAQGNAQGDAPQERPFFKTTATIDLFTADKPFPYDERFWSHLRESLAESALLAGVAWDERAISRGECEENVEGFVDLLGPE